MSIHDTLTRFIYTSDEGTVEVPFSILVDVSTGTYRDWTIREVVEETTIPGTGRTYIEHLGWEPAVTTWTLQFDDCSDYYRLLSLSGQTGTLVVLHGFQSLKGSANPQHQLNQDYEFLDSVWIAGVEGLHEIDGAVEASVTFKRAVDPVTRLAVVS